MNKFLDKVYPYTLFPLFAFPLLKENISMLFLGVFALFTIRYSLVNKTKTIIKSNWLVFSVPFFIVVIASLLRGELVKNLGEINHALLFLVLPIFFFLSSDELFTKEKIVHYFKFLIYCCAVLIFIYILLFLVNHQFYELFATKYNSSLFRDFVYSKTIFFTIHPAYLTSITLFGTAFCIEELKSRFSYLYLFLIILFFSFTFLLLTKLNIVLITMLILYSIFRYSKIKIIYKFSLVLLIAVVSIILIYITPGMMLRILEVINSLNTEPIGAAYDSTNIRKAIYTCDFLLIKENFWYGVGFSELKLELLNCFKENYQSDFYKNHLYLTHNYFIYVLLGSGIFGLISLLYFFYKSYSFLLNFKSLTIGVFMLNTLLMCMIEDYFYRQNGILFFLLILLSLFKFHSKYKTNLFDK
jgi:O-antigen ligase